MEKQDLINKLRSVYDPEINVNIYDLGLIYDIRIDERENVYVLMTLTSPFCPAADLIIGDVVNAGYQSGAKDVEVDITFQPEWGLHLISDEGKLELGLL